MSDAYRRFLDALSAQLRDLAARAGALAGAASLRYPQWHARFTAYSAAAQRASATARSRVANFALSRGHRDPHEAFASLYARLKANLATKASWRFGAGAAAFITMCSLFTSSEFAREILTTDYSREVAEADFARRVRGDTPKLNAAPPQAREIYDRLIDLTILNGAPLPEDVADPWSSALAAVADGSNVPPEQQKAVRNAARAYYELLYTRNRSHPPAFRMSDPNKIEYAGSANLNDTMSGVRTALVNKLETANKEALIRELIKEDDNARALVEKYNQSRANSGSESAVAAAGNPAGNRMAGWGSTAQFAGGVGGIDSHGYANSLSGSGSGAAGPKLQTVGASVEQAYRASVGYLPDTAYQVRVSDKDTKENL